MTGNGRLIISIDCEGLWGLADHVEPYLGEINTGSLTWAYRSLLSLLDRTEISATFAIVSLFASEPEEIREELNKLDALPSHREWVAPVSRAFRADSLEGWALPQVFDWIASETGHEIASHSHTHLPMVTATDVTRSAAVEKDGVERWALARGIDLKTYVFPRNQVVNGEGLLAESIVGVRAQTQMGGRVRRTLDELNLRKEAQSDPEAVDAVDTVSIPGGFICNVRSGPRRAIPMWVTRQRWRSICRDAAENGRVAHLWLHPHNLITGHRQLDLLELMLLDAATLVRNGDLHVQTQQDYVASQLTNTTSHRHVDLREAPPAERVTDSEVRP